MDGGYMDEAHRELVRAWLSKAGSDLGSARKLASEPDPYPDTAVYHCQQAAEKAVKGYLAFHDQPLKWTHDVAALVQEAILLEPRFSASLDPASLLTPYAARFRYPDEVLDPSREELAEAIGAAEEILRLVLSLLPADIQQ